MTTVKIKHRYTDAVLFECEVPDDIDSGLHVRHALEKATTAGANLRGADLSGVDLRYANLSYVDLRYANLCGADLSGVDLRYADLRGVDLSGADLSYVNLRGADLSGVDLRYVNLCYANLRGVDLSGVDLRYANLSYADLRYVNLSYADLRGVDQSGKKLVGDRPFFTAGPIGSRCDYIQSWITDSGLMIRAGCFFGTRDQFELALDVTHSNNEHAQEYRAALVLIDKHAELWTPVGFRGNCEESVEVAA